MTRTTTKTALDVFDEVFAETFTGTTWAAWRAFLAALFGLPATEAEAAIIRECSGRSTLPTAPAREAWMVVGRRGGKSRIAAFLAVFAACFRRYPLAAGEHGVVMVLAADRKQAGVIFRYVAALLDAVPMLAALVRERTKETITLTTGVMITVQTSSYRSVRGYTVVACIADEIAFWQNAEESANPDHEILAALRPAMATIPDALLVALSSPYARRGELWSAYERHFGIDDDPVLVWQAPTRRMNPAVPQAFIDSAYADDAASAAAEYGAEFRRDISTFIGKELLDSAKAPDRLELPAMSGVRYVAFTDPAGGSGGDSFTLAIAHRTTEGRVVLDCVREQRPPFSPEQSAESFAETVLLYGLREVSGDRYAGEWPREQFAKHGVTYRTADKTKSDLYREFLPLLTAGRVELLDHPRLLKQFGALERRTSRGGKDSIDHPPRQHDDLSNAASGALVLASGAFTRTTAGAMYLPALMI
jgi:hypothetical protein